VPRLVEHFLDGTQPLGDRRGRAISVIQAGVDVDGRTSHLVCSTRSSQ
jgi:hypothetical protein